MSGTIFKYRDLTDFEKTLFLKRQIKELIKAIKEKDFEIGVLTSDIDELKSTYSVKKFHNQKKLIKKLRSEVAELKKDNARLTHRNFELTR